ncbi:MAG: thioesterase domain-containing protein, partial [Limisphaerales bacterium]
SSDLRNFLKEKVPPYSIPSAIVMLASLPLTPNGKVDRRALPEPGPIEEVPSEIKNPRDPLEMQLQLVFEKFLSHRFIGIDMSFFELGGDSLQALKLIVEIERATGKKLPLGILFQASTIEDLAKVIRDQDGHAEWSALVSLQPNGTRPPLFLVHTTPGDVLGYGGLVYHMDSDQPCYGFQSLGLIDQNKSHTRVEEMASYYNHLMRAQQPHGPYFLGGWCYGGIVAVEMAHQLLAAGEKVAPLLLIETPAPAPARSNLRYYFRRIGCLLKMGPRQWKTYLAEKIKYYRGIKTATEMRFKRVEVPHGEDKKMMEEQNRFLAQLEAVYHTNLNALNDYKSRFYPGKIILFNAMEQDPAIVSD